MTDITHEAPERIWAWGWRADSVWQEQTWQHEDEPMSTMEYVRVDLVEAAEQLGYANAMEAERKLHEDRIEAQAAEIKRLEAKLAKAVDALQAFNSFDDLPVEAKRPDIFEIKVRMPILRTLAELKGAKP